MRISAFKEATTKKKWQKTLDFFQYPFYLWKEAKTLDKRNMKTKTLDLKMIESIYHVWGILYTIYRVYIF